MSNPLRTSLYIISRQLDRAAGVKLSKISIASILLALGLGATGAPAEEATVLVVQAQAESGPFIEWTDHVNKEFEAAHPGVKIRLQTKSFSDLTRTLKLQLSGDKVPDVTQVNQGYASMGALVKANLLQDLSPYADKFGWGSRQANAQLAVNGRFSSDGRTFAEGPLYGMSATGAWVGLWMNKKLGQQLGFTSPPSTLAELEHDMQIAKEKGVVPMQFSGDSADGQSHYLLTLLVQSQGHPDLILDIVKGNKDISLTSAPVVKAASTLREWAEKGYFTPNWVAYKGDEAFDKFLGGDGLFAINGSWRLPLPEKTRAQDFTMLTFPSVDPNAKPIAIATGNLPWSIPTKSAHKDLAAEYIDLWTSVDIADRWIAKGGVPVTLPVNIEAALDAAKLEGPSRDAILGWSKVLNGGTPAPYPDWATPTFLNALLSGAAELGTGRITAEQYTQLLQDDYAAFQSDKE
ncbi:ABC transporter substrate-binding protein [Rhizobium miluonense]|uniref:Raffinose/stachyose/melibiose transport system substrate-binding protein n=1 Tax=Rhizobium miluonense TaxID=411945 RepID=A0A1C3V7F9_9HYPH|nr:extracellular solute-binding protein [Rhizobium miluonense]SCB23557.1 raffinose/stachyose/melibiose transport system substrate-binding protein [Rhizobium miluonense]